MHGPEYVEKKWPDGNVMLDAKCAHPGCDFRASVADAKPRVARAEIEKEFTKHRAAFGVSHDEQAPTPKLGQRQGWDLLAESLPWYRHPLAIAGLAIAVVFGATTWLSADEKEEQNAASDSTSSHGATTFNAPPPPPPAPVGPEAADNGPRQYAADSFTSFERNMFVHTLRELDPTFSAETEDSLVALGAEVCESLSNGNSRETVIEVMVGLSGWGGMTTARLVTTADEYLC